MRRAGLRGWSTAPLQVLVAAALAFGVGVGLGALASVFFVIGLLEVLLGLAAGAGAGVIALTSAGPWGWVPRAAAVLAVVVGWCAFQVLEDQHLIASHAARHAELRAVSDAIDPRVLDPEAVAFLARHGRAELEREVVQQTGVGGLPGRFLYRAEAGIRVFGPVEGGRGLAVGLVGALIWHVLQLLLASLIAVAVIRRVETSPA